MTDDKKIKEAGEMMRDLGLLPHANGNDKPSPILTPGTSIKKLFTPRDLAPPQLATLDHVEWLNNFVSILSLNTGVKMTPFREGQITRLHWVAQWIGYLTKALKLQETQIQRLTNKIKLLEGFDDPGSLDSKKTKDQLLHEVRALRSKIEDYELDRTLDQHQEQ